MNLYYIYIQDLQDIEGDKKYNISTFASKYGVQTIANIAASVLSCTYILAILLPFIYPNKFRLIPMALGHTTFLIYFLINFKNLNSDDMSSIKEFYKSIWNLFYLEYLLYPFI